MEQQAQKWLTFDCHQLEDRLDQKYRLQELH